MRWEGLELAGSGMLKGTGLTGRGITVPATWKVVCRDTGKENMNFKSLRAVALDGSSSSKDSSWAVRAGKRGLTCKEMMIPCSEYMGAAKGRY